MMESAYRLAVFCDSAEMGGAERFLEHLLAELPAGVEVCLLGRDRQVLEAIAAARPGTRVTVLPMTYRATLRAVRACRPDVAHANLTALTSCRALVLAALTLRIPVVLVDHLPTPGLTWRGRALQRLVTRRSAARISVGEQSARLAERYAGLPAGTVGAIRNGIPRREPLPARETTTCTFGFLGRLEPQKGLDVLLRALARVPAATVEIMGSGGQAAELARLAVELGLAERVRFTPGSPDTAGFWAGIDVFVLPSRAEGLPLVVLEALQSGRPVLATDVGSIREVLDEQVAVLVPPGDVDALAAALRALAEDADLRDRLAASVRARAVTMWAADDMAAAYDAVYRSALRSG